MIVKQFIKKLNNTELGRTGNDNYVIGSAKAKLTDMFEFDIPIDLRDKKTGELYKGEFKYKGRANTIKCILAGNNQIRISGLGFYWDKYDVSAGDELIIEKQEDGNESTYYIDICQYSDIIMFFRDAKGFQILNMDRIEGLFKDKECKLKVKHKNKASDLTIKWIASDMKNTKKKNKEEKTDFYDLILDETSIFRQVKYQNYLELSIKQDNCMLKEVNMWRKSIIKWGGK